jgi:hypothetical protein
VFFIKRFLSAQVLRGTFHCQARARMSFESQGLCDAAHGWCTLAQFVCGFSRGTWREAPVDHARSAWRGASDQYAKCVGPW